MMMVMMIMMMLEVYVHTYLPTYLDLSGGILPVLTVLSLLFGLSHSLQCKQFFKLGTCFRLTTLCM